MTSAWIPDVVPHEPIESEWGNLIRDRTITPFPSAAARNAAIPFPIEGMMTYLADTDTVEVFHGARGWTRSWNAPWGWISGPTGITTGGPIGPGTGTLAGSAFTLPKANRRYLILANVSILQNTYTATSHTVTLSIQVGATFPDAQAVGGGGTGFGDSYGVVLMGTIVAASDGAAGSLSYSTAAGISFAISRGQVTVLDIGGTP